MRSVQGQGSVRLLFRLRTGSAGFLEDKKICRMVSNADVCMYDSGVESMWLISWWAVGNLREIGRCCWMMCAELCGPGSGWMNFGEWTRRDRLHCFWKKGWRVYVME